MKRFHYLILYTLLEGISLNMYARDAGIQFEYFQRVIFIQASVNKTDSLLFLFDTGANTSALDVNTAARLKIEGSRGDSVEGTAGIALVQMADIRSLSIGSANVKGLEVTLIDLSFSLAPPGKKIDGILGTDFMKYFVIEIDFANQRIDFSRKPVCDGNSFAMEMDNNIPAVNAMLLDSLPLKLRYDSGASLFTTDSTYINITEDVWTALHDADSTLMPIAYFQGTGTGGIVKLPVVPVHSAKIFGKSVPYPFLIVQPKQGYFARTDAIGFFGNNLVEKYGRIILDFQRSRICLPDN